MNVLKLILRRLWLLVLCAGLTLALFGAAQEFIRNRPGGIEARESARVRSCYNLDIGRWTTFRIPTGKRQIKIVTNGNVPASYFGNRRLRASYGVQYQLLSEDGEPLFDEIHAFSSRFFVYRSRKSGAVVPSQYYLDSRVLPLSSRATILNFDGLREAPSRLRMRLGWTDQAVEGVVARVYQKEDLAARKTGYLWRRASLEKKRRLASSNIYTMDLLTEAEKSNLLMNSWTALGPLGMDGRDYEERKLYTLSRENADAVQDGILPWGQFVGEGIRGVIPLPEGGGCVRLEFVQVAGSFGGDPSPQVVVTWFGRLSGERKDTLVRLGAPVSFLSGDYGDGMLEIDSDERVVVKASCDGFGEDNDITPQPECIAGFIAGAEDGIRFRKGGAPSAATPVRVDIRQFWREGDGPRPAPARIRYEIAGEGDEIIETGVLQHARDLSAYDNLLGLLGEAKLTDVSRFFFVLGPRCRYLRLRSPDPNVLVTAYTRPAGLERRVRVPERYVRFETNGEEDLDWFFFRPENYAECVRTHREVLVRVQRRPPSGAAAWSLREHGITVHEPLRAAGRYEVLARIRKKWPQRDGASLARLVAVRPGEVAPLQLDGLPGARWLQPRVLFARETDAIREIAVFLDGKLHCRRVLTGRTGEFFLDPVPPGPHDLRWRLGEPGTLYVSSVLDTERDLFLKRTVFRVDELGLTYRIVTDPGEPRTLSLRLFHPAEFSRLPGARVVVRVAVDDAARPVNFPLSSWSFSETVYSVKAGEGDPAPVFGGGGDWVLATEPFFFTLGSDLPAGEKVVRVSIEEGPSSYVQVTEVQPERKTTRRVFLEDDAAPQGTGGADAP